MGPDKEIRLGGHRPEELPAELKQTEERLRQVADYEQFNACSEELSEEELELVTAAGACDAYARFLEKMRRDG